MSLPIACELTPETLKTRRAALLPALVSRAERREELKTHNRVVLEFS